MSVSDLVGEIEGVRRRTRRASRGGAVPLAILGLLVTGAAPVYAAAADRYMDPQPFGETTYVIMHPRITLADRLLRAHPNMTDDLGIGLYWLLVPPLAFAAVAAYYLWRAHRTGLSIDGWRVAAIGAGLFALLVAVMAYAGGQLEPDPYYSGFRLTDLVNPFLVVALAVLVLAWVERSRAIAVAGTLFLGLVVFANAFVYPDPRNGGWRNVASWGWATLVLGGVLLVSSGIVALVRRPRA